MLPVTPKQLLATLAVAASWRPRIAVADGTSNTLVT